MQYHFVFALQTKHVRLVSFVLLPWLTISYGRPGHMWIRSETLFATASFSTSLLIAFFGRRWWGGWQGSWCWGRINIELLSWLSDIFEVDCEFHGTWIHTRWGWRRCLSSSFVHFWFYENLLHFLEHLNGFLSIDEIMRVPSCTRGGMKCIGINIALSLECIGM